MTTLAYLHEIVLPSAYALLPDEMNSTPATAMLLAIALQESGAEHRRQVGGPARGFWQFERGGGVLGVLMHPSVDDAIGPVLLALRYPARSEDCYAAIEHNDILAACFARCLLWTLPAALPGRGHAPQAYAQYLDAWRPGKPHPETWFANYAAGWNVATGRTEEIPQHGRT